MNRKSAIAAAILAGGATWIAPAAWSQTAPARVVDVRSIAPSPTTTPEVAASASGLTRDERKEQTMKAREAGTLKPAGEGGEFRDDAAIRSVRRAAAPAAAPAKTGAAPLPEPRLQAAATPAAKASGQPAHRVRKKSTAKASGPGKHSASPVG